MKPQKAPVGLKGLRSLERVLGGDRYPVDRGGGHLRDLAGVVVSDAALISVGLIGVGVRVIVVGAGLVVFGDFVIVSVACEDRAGQRRGLMAQVEPVTHAIDRGHGHLRDKQPHQRCDQRSQQSRVSVATIHLEGPCAIPTEVRPG